MQKILISLLGIALSFSSSATAQTDSVLGRVLSCEGCPDFVEVPEPPSYLRQISHVATVELTWNQYLVSVDDEACAIPRTDFGLNGPEGKRELDAYVEFLRIDWPATRLGPAEVECYARWLSKRICRPVAVPTASEWLWFARSGRNDGAFPWGDEPREGAAAVGGFEAIGTHGHGGEIRVPFASGPRAPISHYMDGVRVAQYPPTDWGLYDILGNSWELTSDITDPDPESDSLTSGYFAGSKRVRIMGQHAWVTDWETKSITGAPNFAWIINERYSTSVAVRFVLLDQ